MSKTNIYKVELTLAEEVESGQRSVPDLVRELQGTTSNEVSVAVNRVSKDGETLYEFNSLPEESDLYHLRRVIATCNSFERREALTRLLNKLESE